MEKIKVSEPISGVPQKYESEIQKKIYNILSSLEIDFKRVENDPAVTMEDCKAIDEAFGIETIKTILLTNRQKTKFYLLGMPADKPFVTKDFGAALQIPRVSFADTDLLNSLLKTPRGAATPLSIVEDEENKVSLILDKELSEREYLVCTDGTLHGFICLKTEDLINKFFPYSNHNLQLIEL